VAALGYGVLGGLPLGVRAPFDAAASGLFCVVGAITRSIGGCRGSARCSSAR
jgi:hypothetical protein